MNPSSIQDKGIAIPKVSVIMSVYNAEKYIEETINSILGQSFTDFEFLIVDDASTDMSLDLISAIKDPRIKVLRNDFNLGYVKNLNNLIDVARGEYIARQDHDDISLPERLRQQVDFLDNNVDVGICGTNAKIFGGKCWKTNVPIRDAEIRASMIMRNPFLHSSIMLRGNLFRDGTIGKYDDKYYPAEDYALWFEISKKTKLANLPDILLLNRWHKQSVSQLQENMQIQQSCNIRHMVLEKSLSMRMTVEEKKLYDLLFNSYKFSFEEIRQIESLWIRIIRRNETVKYYSQRALKKIFLNSLTMICFGKGQYPFYLAVRVYATSRIFNIFNLLEQFTFSRLRFLLSIKSGIRNITGFNSKCN